MRRMAIIGGTPLNGRVAISGSKNTALPILAATILLHGDITLKNIPFLNDVITMIRVLRSLGIRAEYFEPNTVRIVVDDTVKHVAPYELVTKMRATFFIIGPILARNGMAKVPLPGGCAIGSRPVNIHLKGLEQLGAEIRVEHGVVIAHAKQLRGARIYLDFPSVGATETLIMAASLAEGTTIIENAAKEPEIGDLGSFLNQAGAKISGAGMETVVIEGVPNLHGVNYSVIPDRIEAGTFMIAAALTKGDVTIAPIIPSHIEAIVQKLRESGVHVDLGSDQVRVSTNGVVRSIDAKTMPFPGFPTDMQPQLIALMTKAAGTSIITETIFEHRTMHINELRRMGANIRIEDRSAVITGVPRLSGAPVRASDLRAGAALVVAGLAADGETLVEDMERQIDRGYEKFCEKLCGIGARVTVVD